MLFITISGWLSLSCYWLKYSELRLLFMSSTYILFMLSTYILFSIDNGPRGLTFTWCGCCRLYFWHKPTELAHFFSFFFSALVLFCLYGPFNCILIRKFSRQLSAFTLCSSGLISAWMVFSTIYLFVKISFSPDVIFCGWLGLKHQLTKHWQYNVPNTLLRVQYWFYQLWHHLFWWQCNEHSFLFVH